MSAKLESTYNESPDRTALRLKQPRLAMSSLANSSSPNHEVTDRLCLNRSNVTRNLQNIYMKETERYLIKSYYNSPVVLTQNEQSSLEQQVGSSWKFFQNADARKVEDEVNRFQILLQKFGLLEVFRTFQLCREKLIEILSEDDKAESNKNKIQVFELSKANDRSMEQGENEEQMKEILMRLSKLRKENDLLRDKNAQLYQRLKRYQNSQSFIENSLFYNSFQMNNSSQYGEQSLNSLSFDLQLRNLKLNQLQTLSSSSLKQSKKSSSIKPEKEGKSQINTSNESSHKQYTCLYHQTWKQLLMRTIKTAKNLFKHQFEATNVALLKKDCQNELKNILKTYKAYKRITSGQNQQDYLTQSCNFIKFLEDHSYKLLILVNNSLSQTKLKKEIKSETIE